MGRKDTHQAEGQQDESAHLNNEKCGPCEFQVLSTSKILTPFVRAGELNRKFHGGSHI